MPVTVLSRCQRFDLRRVDVPVMTEFFRGILAKEGATADDEALAVIARAAGGSVRDGLSILDQGIAMGSGKVTGADARAMLGLADRGRVFDLLDQLFAGQPAKALAVLGALYGDGADPLQVLVDLAEAVHITTRAKVAGADAAGEGLSAEEKRRAGAIASGLSIAILSRAWQMLTKGIEDAARAPSPLAAAEMVLIRIAYTADLPSPDEIIRALGSGPEKGQGGPGPNPPSREDRAPSGPLNAAPPPAMKPPAPAPEAGPAPAPPWDAYEAEPTGLDAPLPDPDDDMAEIAADIGPSLAGAAQPIAVNSFQDVVDLAGLRRDAKLKVHLEEHVSLVRFDPAGSIELHLLANAPKELGNNLREKLNAWTGKRWTIALGGRLGEAPVGEVQRQRAAAELEQLKQHPAVAELMREFPDAKISTVKPLARRKTGG